MLRRLGYACICLSIEARSSKGTILRNATPERLRSLIEANLGGLRQMLEFNRERGILLFRISSDVVPFGGHPVNELRWWEEFATPLAQMGAFVRDNGLRVSMHPGQYTLLSSPEERITAAAVADLTWHARFLDAMGLNAEHKLVIHGGGIYGDKPAAIARWVERYHALSPAIRRRLVVENDERTYSADDVLELNRRTGTPVVLDTLHHMLKPGDPARPLGDLLPEVFRTWRAEDGPPKLHFSSQAGDKRPGAHADYADTDEFVAFLESAPDQPFDCMLEAKAKDLALFRLRDDLAARGIRESTAAPV